MTQQDKAFRDYATRISFNLSLSRNQVGHLAGVIADIELAKALGWDERYDACKDAVADAGGKLQLFVQGRGSLQRMGLIAPAKGWQDYWDNKTKQSPPWPQYNLTPAGEHVVELLRIAGLLPQAAANTNKVKGKKKKVA